MTEFRRHVGRAVSRLLGLPPHETSYTVRHGLWVAAGSRSPRCSPRCMPLDAAAHRFAAGSRIRLLVAGGSHPQFARNLGTSEPPISGSRLVRATHTVCHGDGGVSRLVLPAGPQPPSAD